MSAPYRVLVAGSRTWNAEGTLRLALHEAYRAAMATGADRVIVVHGACPRGADAMADTWIRDHAQTAPVAAERHPAKWRHADMVVLGADLCLAFIRNNSPGATHCAGLAKKAGIPVRYWRAP